ncbi:vitamin B12 dependent methionine synthase activation domain protein [Clostridia bacterium]|nr:vitamin B12 dependent methionine synthase activation domain protein [Clostridia bacterium]
MSCSADALRYLRVKGIPDEQTVADIDRHLAWIEANIDPRCVLKKFPRSVLPPSVSLDKYVGDDTCIYLLAATLGAAADARLRTLEAWSMSDAAVFDACASAYIEQVCDKVFAGARFAPGYGDLPLSWQAELCKLLETPKRIGLTVTDSFILLPMKSITSVIAPHRGRFL